MGAEKWGGPLREICDQDMVFIKEGATALSDYAVRADAIKGETYDRREGGTTAGGQSLRKREAQSTGRGKAGPVSPDSGRVVGLVMG